MKPAALLILSLLALSAQATERSAAARADFMRQQPCPVTGRTEGSCPGYIVDHKNPLACGGPDAPENMQWQTVDEAKAKDRWERIRCSMTSIVARNRLVKFEIPFFSKPTCGDKAFCRDMDSCKEARHYLTECGQTQLDGDQDGIPCESICR